MHTLFDSDNRTIFVAAHRGDWRDAPENSLESLRDAARLGVPIVEMDLKRTRDNELVVMHDRTLDRTTTGSGPVSDRSLAELKQLRLRAGTGHPTAHTIPTFAEELAAARTNDVILDIDQAWDYLPDVVRDLRADGAVGQVILNVFPNVSYDELVRRVGEIPPDLALMIVVNMGRPDAAQIIGSYRAHRLTVVQCIFDAAAAGAMERVGQERGSLPLWINSLWPDQNADHDDDRAVEQQQPAETWGWLIGRGATILQTDRPRELLAYLRQQHLLAP